MVLAQKQTYRHQWKRKENLEINPHTYGQISLQQRRQKYTMEKGQSLHQTVPGKVEQPHENK